MLDRVLAGCPSTAMLMVPQPVASNQSPPPTPEPPLSVSDALARWADNGNGADYLRGSAPRRCCMNTRCGWGGVARTSRDPPQEPHYGDEVEGSSHV